MSSKLSGQFTSIGGQARNRIARLDATTGAPDSFDPHSTDSDITVSSIAVQTDGMILVGGNFSNLGGQTRHGIARLDASTGLADSFDPSASGAINSIVLQADDLSDADLDALLREVTDELGDAVEEAEIADITNAITASVRSSLVPADSGALRAIG